MTTSPRTFYIKLTAVINNFYSQLGATLPHSTKVLNALVNDPDYETLATAQIKTNVATLQALVAQAAATLETINWDNV
jgi:hypothetical protein